MKKLKTSFKGFGFLNRMSVSGDFSVVCMRKMEVNKIEDILNF